MVLLLSFFGLIGQSSAQLWSGVLSPARATDWTQAGIPGGIPSSSWTQCGPTIAPYGSSGSSASPSTIVNALNHSGNGYTGCGPNTYVQLGAGTFYLNAAIRVLGANNTELRGMGASQTKIVFTGASTCQGGNGTCLVAFESSDGTYPAQPPANIFNWTAGYSQGATSITLSKGSNITANSTMLVLDQCDTGYSGSPCSGSSGDNRNFYSCGDKYQGGTGCSVNGPDAGLARPHRFQLEAVEVTACSPSCGNSGATTVTINPPLQHPNWASGQTPQVWLIQPSRYVGVRNLSIDGAATTCTAGLSFFNDAYFWAEGVSVLNPYNIGIWVEQSIHGTVQSNYVFNAGQNLRYMDPTGIKFNWSNNLYANNIVQAVRPFFMAEGPANGNVMVGNFTTNSFTNDDFMFGGIWDGHSNGADYQLFESNVTNQFFQDQIHGSHLMETTFRNLFTGFESCANGQCGSFKAKASSVAAYDALSYNRYGNSIANVLGTPGSTTGGYTSSTNGYILGGTSGWVYILGSGNGAASPAIPLDNVAVDTMYRWGNYDTFSGTVRWNTGEVPTGISPYPQSVPNATCTSSQPCPPSFYYTSRPTWWPTTLPFPAIGPDVVGGNLGVCSGALNTAGHQSGLPATASDSCTGTSLNASQWAGHVNAIPAQNCYLNVMGGPPDGSGDALAFDADACYSNSQNQIEPPTGLHADTH